MARRATDPHPHPLAELTKQAWKNSELPIEEVVFRYKTAATQQGFSRENGMLMGAAAVKRWCYGWSIPQAHQYQVLASVLNPVLKERGKTQLPAMDLSHAFEMIAIESKKAAGSFSSQSSREAHNLYFAFSPLDLPERLAS